MKVLEFQDPACRRVAELLDAYASDELSVESAGEVERHLRRCSDCSAKLAAIERTRAAVRSAVESQAVPPGLSDRVRAASGGRKTSLPVRWLAAAAAAVILIAGFAVSKRITGAYPHQLAYQQVRIHRLARQVPALFGPPIADHVHCALYRAYPDEPPPAELTVQELGPDADLRPIIEHAAPEGFALRLAHRCRAAGREFLHFVLVRDGRLASVSMTLRQPGESLAGIDSEPLGEGVFFDRADELRLAGFQAGDYFVFVVSDVAREPVVELARNLRSHDEIANRSRRKA